MFAELTKLGARFTVFRVGNMLLVVSLVAMPFADFWVHTAHAGSTHCVNGANMHGSIDHSPSSHEERGNYADPEKENERSTPNGVFCDPAHCCVFVAPTIVAVVDPITRTAKTARGGPNFLSRPPVLLERPPKSST